MDAINKKELPSLQARYESLLRKNSKRVVTQEPILTKLGAALRKLREDEGITLRSMAKHVGISAPFLSDCELGRRRLSFEATILFLQRVKLGEDK